MKFNKKVIAWTVVVACGVALLLGADLLSSVAEAGRRYVLP